MRGLISTSLMVVFLSSVILYAGCGGPTMGPTGKLAETTPARPAAAAQTTEVAAPEWFVNVPKDPVYLYAAGTAQSKDMQMALDMAKHYARLEIAKQVEVKIERSFGEPPDLQSNAGSAAVSKRVTSNGSTFVSRETTAEGTTVVSKETTSTVILRGVRVSKQELRQEAGFLYRAYVLMEMPAEEANVMAEYKTQDARHEMEARDTGLKPSREDVQKHKSKWLEELEATMEKYEQWKKKKEQSQ